MSISTPSLTGTRQTQPAQLAQQLRAYFWSDRVRAVQSVLGLLWLLDSGLQMQPFMYSHGFMQMLLDNAAGQPGWVRDSIVWGVTFANANLSLWNTLFALIQVFLGLGILYRPTVKRALAASFAWALFVWWFGEAFGMLFMNMAQPLTGAPGGVFMYALVGLVVWPNGRPGGLLGAHGARTMWVALWLVMAWLWLLEPSSSANATSSMLTSTSSGIGALSNLQQSLAASAAGHGLLIALVLAALSAAIGLASALRWQTSLFIGISIVLSLLYWIIPQGLGGIFAGGSTDPNSGPLFMLMAVAVAPLFVGAREAPATGTAETDSPSTPGTDSTSTPETASARALEAP